MTIQPYTERTVHEKKMAIIHSFSLESIKNQLLSVIFILFICYVSKIHTTQFVIICLDEGFSLFTFKLFSFLSFFLFSLSSFHNLNAYKRAHKQQKGDERESK